MLLPFLNLFFNPLMRSDIKTTSTIVHIFTEYMKLELLGKILEPLNSITGVAVFLRVFCAALWM